MSPGPYRFVGNCYAEGCAHRLIASKPCGRRRALQSLMPVIRASSRIGCAACLG